MTGPVLQIEPGNTNLKIEGQKSSFSLHGRTQGPALR